MNGKATLIILAGGRSSRMGKPKHLLATSRGDTIVEHLASKLGYMFSETLVVGIDPSEPVANLRVVKDVYDIRSPLVGLYSGLISASNNLSFVVACDMPFVKRPLVRHIIDVCGNADVCVPVVNGYYEPLCAAYNRTAILAIDEAINKGIYKLTSIYNSLQVRTIPEQEVRLFDDTLISFTNLNLPRQLPLLAKL